jgi:hypothetical protein
MKSALSILSHYLPQITNLHDFLHSRCDVETLTLIMDSTSQFDVFETFLKSTLIAPKQGDWSPGDCRMPISSMSEVNAVY